MRKGRISVAGASILFALGLAAWEVYFFWDDGSFPNLGIGLFTPDWLGFNMAWLPALYLTYQLISIPFSLPSAGNRFNMAWLAALYLTYQLISIPFSLPSAGN